MKKKQHCYDCAFLGHAFFRYGDNVDNKPLYYILNGCYNGKEIREKIKNVITENGRIVFKLDSEGEDAIPRYPVCMEKLWESHSGHGDSLKKSDIEEIAKICPCYININTTKKIINVEAIKAIRNKINNDKAQKLERWINTLFAIGTGAITALITSLLTANIFKNKLLDDVLIQMKQVLGIVLSS